MSLAGRRIVITGAGRGLGAALAIAAADLGATPILLARSAESLGRTARTIAQRTGSAPATFVCNLADADAVARAADKVLAEHPDVDVLVIPERSGAAGRWPVWRMPTSQQRWLRCSPERSC